MKNKSIEHSEEIEWNKFLKKQFPLPVLVGKISYYQNQNLIVPKDDFYILNKKMEIIDTFTGEIFDKFNFSKELLDFISKYKLLQRDIIGCEDLSDIKNELFINFLDKYENVDFKEESSLQYLKYKTLFKIYKKWNIT
jgi:hypothetical protein